uniref:DNA-directed RNA polymerase III subunit RPC3 n=1 Tax=Aegilops tauschii TaxID=37682 RepID=M8BD94_AEGTA
MVSQHGILLAAGLISDHFGPLVAKVCDCLLRHGALQLTEIVRRLKLPQGQVKNSLLVLIQHNCVQAFSSPRGKPVCKSLGYMIRFDALLVCDSINLSVIVGDRTITLYLAIFDNVLHRLRFSKFISVIRADIPECKMNRFIFVLFDHVVDELYVIRRTGVGQTPVIWFAPFYKTKSETLIEGLLQNGRLTFDQLVGRTISKVPEGTIRPAREEIRMNFNKLVYARYVERCPKAEPYFNPQEDEQSTAARRRVPKTAEEVLSLEQKVVNTATLSDPERFSEIPYGMEDASKTNDCPHNAVAGAKRKHGAFEIDEELNSTIAENEVLWRVNFEKFIFCLKKKFCADRKKPKLKKGSLGAVVKLLPCDHEVMGSSPGNSLLQKWERLRTIDPKWSDPSPDPAQAGATCTGAALVLPLGEGGKTILAISCELFPTSITLSSILSVTSSTNGILEKLGQKEGTAAMTIGDIKPVLLDLQCTTSDGEEFTFDLRKMVEACRNEEIESLVKKKYGQEAFTIFRLLVTQGCAVETDQIIDTTILDKQIVHSTLYKLWNDGYIDTEFKKAI